jgi:flagellar biosynthetic protein FliQ
VTDSDLVADAAASALRIVLEIAAPVVLPVLAAALLVGLVQAATSISEATLSFVPKLVVAGAALLLGGALMLRLLTDFTLELYDRIPALLR